MAMRNAKVFFIFLPFLLVPLANMELEFCPVISRLQKLIRQVKVSHGLYSSDVEILVFSDVDLISDCLKNKDTTGESLEVFSVIASPSNIKDCGSKYKRSCPFVFHRAESNSDKIAALFLPSNYSQLLEIMQKLFPGAATSSGRRRWCSTIFILWPFQIPNVKEIGTVLAETLGEFLDYITIRDEILFVFQNVDSWSIWEVYAFTFRISLNRNLGSTNVSGIEENVEINLIWQAANSSNHESAIRTKLSRRRNFKHTLIKAVAPTSSGIYLEVDWKKDKRTGKVTFLGGMAIHLMRDLQELMNFRLEILPGDFFLTTSPQANTNASAYKPITAELLSSRKVEIMIGHTTPIPSRLAQLDILMPSLYNRLWAYIHEPPARYVRNVFLAPFYTKLWVALTVTWVLILGTMKLAVVITRRTCYRFIDGLIAISEYPVDPFSFDIYFWSIATITQQGWELHPSRPPFRIIFMAGSILTIVCYVAYSAAVLAILSMEEIPISSLDSLFKSSLPVYVTLESSNVAELARGLQKEGKIRSSNPFLSNWIGVPKLFEKPMAFIVYDHLLHYGRSYYNISQHEYCAKIKAYPVMKTTQAAVMTMPKDSPLREVFNHKIIFLKERGILLRHQQIFHRDGGVQCPKSYELGTNRSNSALDLNDIFTAILVAAIGSALSLIVLFIENFLRGKPNLLQSPKRK